MYRLVGDSEGVLVCVSFGGISLVGDCEGVLVCVSFGGISLVGELV